MDGSAVEAVVAVLRDRVSVTVADVPVSAEIVVLFGPDLSYADIGESVRVFELLDRAQIEYELKSRLYDLCSSPTPLAVRLAHLQALGVDRTLEAAISEILLAAG